MAYSLKIPFEFDNKEYYEFVWLYERLAEQRKKEEEKERQGEGEMSLANLGPGMLNNLQQNG
jgi:hypothetical protein